MRTALPRAEVSEFPRRARRALVLRSFLVQGSWNYQTLIGTGFAFMLLPALRHIYRDDEQALAAAMVRHSAVFNSHPYFAGIAAGSVARLEADGAEPELISRFKAALRGPLGALGDQLIWSAWRPAAVLLGLAALLAGAPWWLSIALFLLVYNALHLWIRSWALDTGLRGGLHVGDLLRRSPLHEWGRRSGDAGAVLVGFCTVMAVLGTFFERADAVLPAAGDLAEIAGLAAAAAAGYALGPRLRAMAWIVLGLAWITGIMIGALRGPPL